MTYLLFGIGLLCLFFGGEYLVRGASAVARHFRLSPMVIGLTIVGFGTSAPEMLVSVQAALEGRPGIAIGNVVGSNIANILLILGVSALIAPLLIPARKLWRDLGFMLAATAILWVMLLDGDISRLEGILLLAGLATFLGVAFLTGKQDSDEVTVGDIPQWKAWAMTAAGLVVLVVGARLLVDSATELARGFGISEAVIGLTIVAVGTSLPELATSVIAAIRKQTEIAVGNIVGSNVFNIFGILGTTAVIAPIPAEARFALIDMPWAAATAVGLTLLAFLLGGLPRIAGALLLGAYGGYLWLMG
ncbi:calcium/sodium antiporter [Rhodobacteraceae bacterium HSP-20]|uniref:Calcium/sodium antiporter n=1 Tax=Paragemmobacter amnigenus TaxID=2852097 RepID=A0ABS6IXV4_9RHOB|nr:calcium/sodium antiporter [Rhodobacter amnigenus]MBU9696341.1 calcium/sodium antiporter [Rhodobacter amnigenus]MBV4387568.1 calcium/sodium antiporter [Rhodobacter amnigenus]